jgi:exosortase
LISGLQPGATFGFARLVDLCDKFAVMSSSSRIKQASGWLPAGVISLAGFYFLFAWMPYSFGYGNKAIPVTEMLWALWNDYGDWQHGMLVPVVVASLIYWRRNDLKKVPVQGSMWGILALAGTLLFYWAGYKADVQYVGFISIQMFLASLVIFFLGWQFFKAILFPWAFLAFAWPFLFLDNLIAFPLRLVMSEMSFHFLNLIGISAVRVGSAIVSAPDFANGLKQGDRFAVDIADPCSGIRSLFALTMITCVYSYVMLRSWWKQWMMFLMAIPLAVLGNFFRILLLTFGTLAFGPKFAIGTIDNPSTYHMFAGFAVFGVALAGMVSLTSSLQRDWSGASRWRSAAAVIAQHGVRNET